MRDNSHRNKIHSAISSHSLNLKPGQHWLDIGRWIRSSRHSSSRLLFLFCCTLSFSCELLLTQLMWFTLRSQDSNYPLNPDNTVSLLSESDCTGWNSSIWNMGFLLKCIRMHFTHVGVPQKPWNRALAHSSSSLISNRYGSLITNFTDVNKKFILIATVFAFICAVGLFPSVVVFRTRDTIFPPPLQSLAAVPTAISSVLAFIFMIVLFAIAKSKFDKEPSSSASFGPLVSHFPKEVPFDLPWNSLQIWMSLVAMIIQICVTFYTGCGSTWRGPLGEWSPHIRNQNSAVYTYTYWLAFATLKTVEVDLSWMFSIKCKIDQCILVCTVCTVFACISRESPPSSSATPDACDHLSHVALRLES